jgi:hypothetical protein
VKTTGSLDGLLALMRFSNSFSLYREIGQESADFIFTHFGGMSFLMVKDKFPYPFDISLFCPNTIVFAANPVSNLIQ